MSQAKLREALAGGVPIKDKGPPVADGTLAPSVPTPESIQWRNKTSIIDTITSSSSYLDPQPSSSTSSSLTDSQKGGHTTINNNDLIVNGTYRLHAILCILSSSSRTHSLTHVFNDCIVFNRNIIVVWKIHMAHPKFRGRPCGQAGAAFQHLSSGPLSVVHSSLPPRMRRIQSSILVSMRG